jgi:hypothetical protein
MLIDKCLPLIQTLNDNGLVYCVFSLFVYFCFESLGCLNLVFILFCYAFHNLIKVIPEYSFLAELFWVNFNDLLNRCNETVYKLVMFIFHFFFYFSMNKSFVVFNDACFSYTYFAELFCGFSFAQILFSPPRYYGFLHSLCTHAIHRHTSEFQCFIFKPIYN